MKCGQVREARSASTGDGETQRALYRFVRLASSYFFTLFGGGAISAQRWRENFGDEYRLSAKGKARTSCPQDFRGRVGQLQGVNRRPEKRLPGVESTVAERTANESWMREKQRAERAIVQACQPAAERSARSARQYGVGENKRQSINSQCHLTHMEQAVAFDPERACLVERGPRQALLQQAQGEAAARLQTRGQRSAVKQPACDVGCVTR